MSEHVDRERPYVFVSYASVDRAAVLSCVDAMRQTGIAAWVDQADITGGVSYGPEITTGIKESSALVLMWVRSVIHFGYLPECRDSLQGVAPRSKAASAKRGPFGPFAAPGRDGPAC